MDMEDQITQAITAELERQAEDGGLKVEDPRDGMLRLEGRIDLEALAMAVAGAVAGGP
jgi:hypothetical protein